MVYPEGVAAAVAADLAGWARPMVGLAGTELPGDFRAYPRAQRWSAAAAVRRTLVEQAEKSSRRRWSQVWGRRADALQRLMLALKGVRAEVWLEREEVPRGGLGKGYVVLHGHAQVKDVRVVSGAREGAEVRQPARQTPFDDRPRGRLASSRGFKSQCFSLPKMLQEKVPLQSSSRGGQNYEPRKIS